ncbi:MAG TPA: DNA cytosine methyltransferase, partial [Aquihabitans sp.]|nr:DNA cytosine methyltransferase [Aquihabitans sp.]
MTPPTALSAFSGVGGFDLGLEQAHFDVLGCIESDEVARRSLKANRPEWPILEPGDIELLASELHPNQLGLSPGELTVLVGAPPCQPYSKAALWASGSWAGFADPRAKPLLSFMELVERFQPRAVLMENVQGFVYGKHSVLPLIQELFGGINERTDCGYRVDARLINAADFGVPQHRRRAIVVALRDDLEMTWPSATHHERPTRAWDALADIPPEVHPPVASGRWA